MTSIQARLNLGLAASLILIFAVLGIGGGFAFQYLAEKYVLSRLEHDAESLLLALEPMLPGGALVLHGGRTNPIYQRAFSGHYYELYVNHQQTRSRSLWDQQLPVQLSQQELKERQSGVVRVVHGRGPDDNQLLIRISHYTKFGQPVSIVIAEDLTPIRADVWAFQVRFAAGAMLALVFLLVLQWRMLRAALLPLTRTGQEIERLERGELKALNTDVPRELRPLVGQINLLLERMQGRLTRSRNALGNLAHALKTPLTLIGRTLESDIRPLVPEATQVLQEQVDEVRARIERELKRARLAGAGERVALGEEVDGLLQVLRRMYAERALDIRCELDRSAAVCMDREDLIELLGNLADNACKWARSRVLIRARDGDPQVLSVEDDGPGVDASRLIELQGRGVRADEAGVPGHGLGLAIVRDVVNHYGGTLQLGRSRELGGFLAEVRLPARLKEQCATAD